MRYADTFQVTTPGDCEIELARDFEAPVQLLFDAFTKPELVRRWLLGPPGWSMPVCEIDLRVGGTYRYVWRKEGIPDMGMKGVFREIDAPTLIVVTEQFDVAWYPGEALNTTSFAQKGNVTRATIRLRYQSQEAREIARRSGMDLGMAASLNRLAELMAERSRNVTASTT